MTRFMWALVIFFCLMDLEENPLCKVVVTRHPVCESSIQEETCAIFACPATAEEIALYGVKP